MSAKRPSLEALLKLLNDEDDIARSAILQLLQHYSNEMENILRQLQECDNETMRKRSHQIQALITFKQRRERLHNILLNKNNQFRMYDALTDLHLLWFEKDTSAEIETYYRKLLKDFPQSKAGKPFAVTDFLKRKQFIPQDDSTSNTDYCMIGNVFEHLSGTNAFLCALVTAIQEDLNLPHELEIIQVDQRFCLYHRPTGMVCDITAHWQVHSLNFSGGKTFSKSELLRYICALCFCNTVHDDAFRYVHIFSDILLPDHDSSILPYPYNGRE